MYWKSILKVPDTGTRVLDNTRPFLCSSIVSFWITLACSISITFSGNTGTPKMFQYLTNTGTFQYLGPEVYFFLCIKLSSKFKNLSSELPVTIYLSGKLVDVQFLSPSLYWEDKVISNWMKIQPFVSMSLLSGWPRGLSLLEKQLLSERKSRVVGWF